MTNERDPAIVAFERAVRREATIHRMQAVHRMRILKGSARTWWTVRMFLRDRRERK